MPTHRLSIRRKLILFGVGVSAAVLIVCAAGFITHDLIRIKRAMSENLNVQARIIAAQAERPLLSGDRQALWFVLQALDANAGVSAAWIRTLAGETVAAYHRNPAAPLEIPAAAFKDAAVTRSHVTLRVPIQNYGETVGYVDIAAEKSMLSRDLQHYALIAVATLLVALAAAFVLSSGLQSIISAPVLALRDVAKRVISERNYALRAPSGNDDELGELTANFNDMLDHMEQRDAMLEQQVKERTHELVRLNDQLKHQAYHDALTRLPNRALLDDRLTLAIAQAERYRGKLAVMFLDLDNFKQINDTLGHEYGDELLRQVAVRLRNAIRSNDTVARLGGDEFTIVATEIESPDDAAQVASTIIRAVREPYEIIGKESQLTVSIGISIYPDDGDHVSVLKRNADTAMYHAKDRGRNNYQFFSRELNTRVRNRLLMLSELEQAIQGQEVFTLYRARMEAVSEQIIGAEALVRWRHPQQGLLGPAEIARYAAEAGLSSRLDQWLAEDAVRCFARWRKHVPRALSLTLPLSAQSLLDERVVLYLQHLADRGGVDAGDVEIEVAEDALTKNPQRLAASLAGIKSAGFRLALGQFGSGAAAVDDLNRYPFDALKLDRSLVRGLAQTPAHGRLVEAVLALARTLGLAVIADEVDDERTRELLLELGCDYLQGAVIHPPQEAAAFESMVRLPAARVLAGASSA